MVYTQYYTLLYLLYILFMAWRIDFSWSSVYKKTSWNAKGLRKGRIWYFCHKDTNKDWL